MERDRLRSISARAVTSQPPGSTLRIIVTSRDRHALPVVVGGCHRSGTSLLRRLLDSHSAIHCGPELPFFRDFYGEYAADPYAHLRFSTTVRSVLPEPAALELLGRAFLDIHEAAALAAGKRRWADKSPDNVLHLAGWDALLEDRWLFVFVVRNPLDTLASMAGRPFPLSVPANLPDRAAHYMRYLEAGLAHMRDRPSHARLVVYEQLVTEPEVVLGELMVWLGEELEPHQVNYGRRPHQHGLEDPKVGQFSSPHIESLHRWTDRLTPEQGLEAWRATNAVWAKIDPTSIWVRAPGSPGRPPT